MSKRPSGGNPEKPGTSPRRRLPAALFVFLGVTSLVILAGGIVLADWWIALPDDIHPQYVGRGKCVECHQSQAHLFEGSHHDLAMDRAADDTVLGDFNDVTFTHHDVVSRLYRDGKRFMINTEGPDGEMHDYEVKYVFGVTPLQQYMVEFDRPEDMPEDEIARLQVLRISWDTLKKKWFYLPPPDVDEKLSPDDDLHWTGIAQRWNNMCADCHSTNLHKNFDAKAGVYHTTFSEIDVSCEACHGPGSNHVKLAEERLLFWDRKQGYGLAELKGDKNEPQVETCARCHSRRRIVHPNYRPGSDYYTCFNNELLMENTYHADGQILDEVYVFGSFLQSKMYHKGIKCSDCHDPHSVKLKHEGNKVCTSCHQHPAAKYDTPAHHRHNTGSTGASCVECHMPETTYMEVDPRRDHSLRVPRPDLSVKFGTPNACTRCHLEPEKLPTEKREQLTQYADWLRAAVGGDKQVQDELDRVDKWAADACLEWYGDKTPKQFHFAEVLAPARDNDPAAEDPLRKLAANREMPAIVRATAVVELGRYSPLVDNIYIEQALRGESTEDRKNAQRMLQNSLQPYQKALDDPDPQVRAAAVAHYEPFIPTSPQPLQQEQLARMIGYLRPLVVDLAPRLDDEARAVRVEAGRVMARLPLEVVGHLLSSEQRDQLQQAIEDFKTGILLDNDRAAAHLTLGILYENMGQDDLAERAYLTGIRVEPRTVGPRGNLAALYDRRAQAADQRARSSAQQGDRDSMQFFAEEMVKNQQAAAQLRAEELELLERDARLAPDIAAVQYRYGLSLYLNGRGAEAEAALRRAWELEPENAQFLSALIAMYQQQERYREAIDLARKLLELEPDYPVYQRWLEELQSQQPVAGPTNP
ncbi:MAG: multiheme c-type cytochrome [Pirellulaceae bacterium]